MRHLLCALGSAAFVVLPAMAAAAPPTLAAPSLPSPAPAAPLDATFQHKPKLPTDKVDLQLEDADLGELVRVIGELTGKRFVIASPKLAKTKAYRVSRLIEKARIV